MQEKLYPLDLKPGLVNNGTKLQSKDRWYTGSLVRFYQGTVQPVGGWVRRTLTGATIAGVPNAAISWTLNDGTAYLAIGTTTHLYVVSAANVVYDITPANGTPQPWAWQLSTFGSYLMAVSNGPGVPPAAANNSFQWTGATGTPAVNTHVAFSAGEPAGIYGLAVTPERFYVLLRGTEVAYIGFPVGKVDTTISSRRVYWASQQTTGTFIPTATNTAGSFDLATEGVPVSGLKTRGQTLIFTTTDLWTMTYIGGDLIYSFAQVGNHCGIVSQHAAVVLDSGAYWMGNGKFFLFNGFVKTIPCDVADYVFLNFNTAQSSKVWVLANPQFGEVTWFYPTAVATECDAYVTYNYQEDHWSFGSLARSCGVPYQAGAANQVPVLVGSDGAIYDHETGNTRTGSTAFLESGPIMLGDGDNVLRLQRIVPDDKTAGDVTASLYTAMYPDAPETLNGPYTLTSPTSIRLTARQVRLRLTESVMTSWRVGIVRIGAIVGGRR